MELNGMRTILKRTVKIMARQRLEIGPAAAVIAIPFRGFLKYLVLIGTGFAQPTLKKSMDKNPNKFMCFMGLSVSLPRFLAVGSPSLYAA
jgi:hypothetical protein